MSNYTQSPKIQARKSNPSITVTTLEQQFGAMADAELIAYESNLRKRLAGASRSQYESICGEFGCDFNEIADDHSPARDGGDLFSFIDEQILRMPRAFRSNYRNDQRDLAIQKSESDRFDRQEKERDQDQEWIRMEKLGIWASGRPPELDTDLPDGSIIIFASKEQSDAVRAKHPNLRGQWNAGVKMDAGGGLTQPGRAGYWLYQKAHARAAAAAYGLSYQPDDDTALDVEEPPVQEHKQTSNLPLHKRIAWADEWDLSGFNASARSLLLRLAIHYDVKAGCCRYSQAALSERMGVSTDTVSRSLRELEEAGVITVERSHRKTNRYILDFSS